MPLHIELRETVDPETGETIYSAVLVEDTEDLKYSITNIKTLKIQRYLTPLIPEDIIYTDY